MKLAIIGASIGQLPICQKAKAMGLQTICFAWEQGAVCKEYVDKFFPISITEKDAILSICEKEKIDGVVSNASDLTAEVVSYIATKLCLHGIDYNKFLNIKDKSYVRQRTHLIPQLTQLYSEIYCGGVSNFHYPCVLKPVTGNSKRGVVFVEKESAFLPALQYSLSQAGNSDILVEQYVDGNEISVETISYEGTHYIVQLTEKENSGPPHFVELAHHQPAQLLQSVKEKISTVVPDILSCIGIFNGASHIELKICGDDIYLIEVNPRGGGDEISNVLVELSTGYDYLQGMINVALGKFHEPIVSDKSFSGIYYLCGQTESRRKYFENNVNCPWMYKKCINRVLNEIKEATGNYDRVGYIVYHSEHKIEL